MISGISLLIALYANGIVAPSRASAAERLSPELTRLLRDLVRTPSVNGRDFEEGVVDLVHRFAKAEGCATNLVYAQPARPTLTVSVGPTDVPGLLIIAHTDTVSDEPRAAWSKNPFGAEIEDGRLYGRGAIDCKGGLVAGLAAVLKAKERGNLKRPISLVCVPDEESGATGRLGILELERRGELKGLGAIYAYPGMDKIVLGHRGVYRFTVKVTGASGHTGSKDWQNADHRNNVLLGASEVALELERLAAKLIRTPGEGYFKDLATVLTPAVITAGTSPGQVPGEARLQVDVRLLPNTDLDGLKEAIAKRIASVRERRAGLSFHLRDDAFIPPTEIKADDLIARAVSHVAKRELGVAPRLMVSGPANESYLLNEMGIPTVILGPTGKNAHGPDEYVELDSIEKAAKIYERMHRLIQRVR